MANKQWPRWVAAVAALAMAGSLPGTALAAPAQGDAASTTPTLSTGNLKSKVSSQLQQAKGEVTAFIQTTSPSALERKNSVLKNFSRQRSALSTLKQRAQSAQAATQSAKTAEKTSVNVFSQLQSLDSSAKKIYSTSYALSGVAVRADAASLRKLAEQSGSVAHITILTPKKALDTTNGSGEAPANKNNDQLVNAVKTWEQAGKTGKGVNIAVVDTGLDYTHADFGGAGTTEAYQTALNSTADPLADPKVSKLLDKTKFKGGYDYAGATYNPNAGNNNPTPDANPIDGQGGHHGTHVAGTALGYGVKADGTSGKTDTAGYQKLTAGDIASWKIGPGAAPEAGIYSYKVFGDNGGTTDLVLEALDGTAKPDVSAPGVGIVSASAGTGNSDEIMSGTSMATPLTSGVAALVRQARPEYLANVVKAQLMNTANHDVLTADRKTAYGPLRVGSGRIDALAAVNNNVQLAGEDNEAITAQFGVIPVGKDGYTDKQTMQLVNNTDHDITYKLTYSARTPVPGVTYSVSGDNGGDTVVAKSGTSTSFRVKISIDQSKLTRTRDATQSAQVAGKDRQYVTDASGIITATPVTQEDDATTLRVPVTSVPKAISETTTELSGFNNKKGTLSVSGHGLDQGDTATGYHSELVPFVYGAEDPVDGYTGNGDAARSLAAGDIRAIGYSSTAPQLSDPSQGLLSFGIITDKTWSHLGNNFIPDVIFDVDGDMKADYMISVSTTEGNTQYDTAWATTTSATTGKVVDEEPIDPAYVSDSNQVVLSVKLSALGFTKDTKVAPIAYMAQIESIYAAGAKDQYIVDTAGGSKDDSFDAYHPALWFGDSATEGNGTVSFPDENGTKVAVHTADDSSETAPKVLALHKNGFFPNIETDEPVIDAHTVKNIDKALLETLVFAASKYQESNYTADSWAAFKKAFDAAKKVLDSDTATQQQVNDAYTALRTAINGLVNATAKPSKDKLKAAVDAAAKLKESDYTADSWAAFVKALDAAKAVLANDNATQEEINNATGALFKAEEALVKKAGTPTNPGKPSQPGVPAKPGASGANSGQNGSNAGVAKTGAAVTGISGAVMLLLAAGATLVIIRRRDAVRR